MGRDAFPYSSLPFDVTFLRLGCFAGARSQLQQKGPLTFARPDMLAARIAFSHGASEATPPILAASPDTVPAAKLGVKGLSSHPGREPRPKPFSVLGGASSIRTRSGRMEASDRRLIAAQLFTVTPFSTLEPSIGER